MMRVEAEGVSKLRVLSRELVQLLWWLVAGGFDVIYYVAVDVTGVSSLIN